MGAEIIPLFQSNCADIVAMARRFADDIEAGKFGEARTAVVVLETEDGTVEAFGWGGDAELVRAIGVLQLGINKLVGLGRGE